MHKIKQTKAHIYSGIRVAKKQTNYKHVTFTVTTACIDDRTGELASLTV